MQSYLRMAKLAIIILLCQLKYTICDNTADPSTYVRPEYSDHVENIPTDSDLFKDLDKPILKQLENAEIETTTTDPDVELTFDRLYLQGIKAYDQHLWHLCASNIEKSIREYRIYKDVLVDCRLDCSKGVRVSKLANISSSIHDFSHFAKLLHDADCFRRCKDDSLSTLPRLTEQLENAFEKRTPYQYLQFCYFKLDRLKQAASAAYTYYLANPDDLDTKKNIVYYRDKAMVPNADFMDLEMVPYKEHYIKFLNAYTEKNWGSVIVELEQCLKEYYIEYERCLANCGVKVRTRGAEFSAEIADMFIQILFCKLNCEEKLSMIYTDPISLFLQDIYHHLQFAYYQEGNLEKSAEATASFLILNSSNAVMKENKNLLKEKMKYADADFIPQKDVVAYAAMQKEMYDLMDFINKNYRWPNHNMTSEDQIEVPDSADQVNEHTDDWMTKYEKLGTHIIAKSVDLHREGRFVADGLLKVEQCEELLVLAKNLKAERTGSQKFDLKLAQKHLQESLDEDYEASLRLFIRAIDIVSQYTQRYLGDDTYLYLKDSSIVCWSQPDNPAANHGCYPQEDGNCIKFDDMCDELPSDAYTTVTYLNTVDGDFQFLNEKEMVDSSFGVKAGRTAGFKTGDRHAVKVPRNIGDNRCALVIRFSTNQGDSDKDYRDTLSLIHRLDELRHANVVKKDHNIMKKFEEEGVKIVKSGEELLGKERFVADGLADDAQCSTLKNMVQELGKAGDGYSGKTSPHTINEIFAGLHLEKIDKVIGIVADEYTKGSSKSLFISPHTEHEMLQGITIYRAAKLTHEGMISTIGLRTFLELSEKSRLLVERYFKLTKPLYFDYTHLVCRTPIDDTKINRQDLSHPVHADNCNLQPDGSCTKDFPAFIHRDYSAILYLNADFDGGEFFFAHSNKSEQVSLRPKCGRLVGFSAGEFHGVRAVRSGQRCALALWFTLDPNYKELAHSHAQKTLKRLEKEQNSEENAVREEL